MSLTSVDTSNEQMMTSDLEPTWTTEQRQPAPSFLYLFICIRPFAPNPHLWILGYPSIFFISSHFLSGLLYHLLFDFSKRSFRFFKACTLNWAFLFIAQELPLLSFIQVTSIFEMYHISSWDRR